jgi:penicillin-binding protein 1A
MVNAFLAVEDHDFFGHGGIYFKGIVRAAWANLTAGDFAQGGSTITQQVAKQFLGSEKSLMRKAKEAIMARRIESRYSKKAILSVYLNHIYLGAGAYGVAAAAQRYFQKDLGQLTLAECALIAGLAQAPSRYSPIHSPDRAIERRDVVLDQMQKYGYATAEEVAAAKKEKLALDVYKDVFPDRMPYYTEQVRRYVLDKYGEDGLMDRGLKVEAAVEPTFEAAAYGNVDYVAHKHDKRQGWRGPVWHLGDDATRQLFVERQKKLYGDGTLAPAKRYLGLVEDVDSRGATVRIGDRELELPLKNMDWAVEWKAGPEQPNDGHLSNATRALTVGDVIWVSREIRTRGKYERWNINSGLNPHWDNPKDERAWDEGHSDIVQLEQIPHPQAGLFSADHRTGYVTTVVGGNDYTSSVYNRMIQACRTPASAFKPMYYSMALNEGYGYDTELYDEKVRITDPVTGVVWEPQNIFEDLDGTVTLEYALVFSKNIPSIGLFKKLGGAKAVEPWLRKLGYTTEFNLDDSLALGSSCVHPSELVHAFATFARGGKKFDWVYVRRITDRDGNIVEDNTATFDPRLSPADRLDRVAAVAGTKPEQAIPERTAFLITKLLKNMFEHGLTRTLRDTEIHGAGKTGTSDWTYDGQFVGFTSRLITMVWLGDDKRVRTLGRDDAAYTSIVPLWGRFMWEAAKYYPNPEVPWWVPAGVDPDDRGDHSKGHRIGRMPLVRHYASDQMEREGLTPPEGTEAGGEGGPPGI